MNAWVYWQPQECKTFERISGIILPFKSEIKLRKQKRDGLNIRYDVSWTQIRQNLYSELLIYECSYLLTLQSVYKWFCLEWNWKTLIDLNGNRLLINLFIFTILLWFLVMWVNHYCKLFTHINSSKRIWVFLYNVM